MTSATFRVCYASVANVLFEHIEQDLLALTTALLDDEDESPGSFPPCQQRQNAAPAQAGS